MKFRVLTFNKSPSTMTRYPILYAIGLRTQFSSVKIFMIDELVKIRLKILFRKD